MPTYEITAPDGRKFRITGDSREGALNALRQHLAQQPAEPFVAPEPPPGFVLDPNTGQMVDVGRIAEEQRQGPLGALGAFGGTAVKGIPFVGEYFDELIGATQGPVAQGVAREQVRQFEEQHPNIALGGQVAAGLSAAVPAALAAAPAVAAAAPTSLLGQTAAGAGAGIFAGGIEGLISGYGAGVDPRSRAVSAGQRAAVGGALGGAVGAVSPLVAALARRAGEFGQRAFRRVRSRTRATRAAENAGISPTAREQVVRALQADEAATGAGEEALQRAGPQAMLAEAGPTSRALLDVATARSGEAGRVAREAVEQRATAAGRELSDVLDKTLGAPKGVRATARSIAERTADEREAAYAAAYASPIDYASDAGRNIEGVLDRIPNRIKRSAIEKANEAMIAEGRRNRQIFMSVADDGTVTITRPPNVEQLDYIKRALGEIAAEEIDQFGRRTGTGRRAARLAADLRTAVGDEDAVPEYGRAVELGGDKIAEDNALALGQRLFRRGTTREEVRELTEDFTRAEKIAARQGLRSTIDEQLAQIQRTITDANVDAREATKIIKEFSSRANREKVGYILGKKPAERLFKEIDKAASSLDLRAAIAENSKTFVRTETGRAIRESIEGGPFYDLAAGRPINATQRVVQALTGTTPEDLLRREDAVFSEIVQALTQTRGEEARRLLRGLLETDVQKQIDAETAARIARVLAGTAAVGGQQAGTQAVIRNGAR